jgi:hypothetical protein
VARQDLKKGNQLGRGGSLLETDHRKLGQSDPKSSHLLDSYESFLSSGSLSVTVKTGPVTENFVASPKKQPSKEVMIASLNIIGPSSIGVITGQRASALSKFKSDTITPPTASPNCGSPITNHPTWHGGEQCEVDQSDQWGVMMATVCT